MQHTLDSKAGTIIRPCHCTHPQQDSLYGKYMRLFNLKAKKETGKARCSVCSKTI